MSCSTNIQFGRNPKLQKMLNAVPEHLRARVDIDKTEKSKTGFQYSLYNVSLPGMYGDLYNPNVFKDENGKLILLDDKKFFSVADIVK